MNTIVGLLTLVAYKIAPEWLALHTLRGLLKQRGVDIAGLPLSATRALSSHALHEHKRLSKFLGYGLTQDAAEFSKQMEITAFQVHCLLHLSNRSDSFLSVCHKAHAILKAHGVDVRPILVDESNKPIS